MSAGAGRADALMAASGLPRAEARALLARLLGVARERLVAHPELAIDAQLAARFAAQAARRRAGVPLAYLVGEQEFHGRPFFVDEAVLVPRPDTETLVDAVLARLPGARPARIADLGTGSGCIAITLALLRPAAQVVGTDASAAALRVARRNAQALGATVQWLQADWFDAQAWARLPAGSFDVIVSNPPYIAAGDAHLRALHAEPAAALVSGADGLEALCAIVAAAPARLAAGGLLAVEHGYDQRAAVVGLFEQAQFTSIAAIDDAAGLPRVCLGSR